MGQILCFPTLSLVRIDTTTVYILRHKLYKPSCVISKGGGYFQRKEWTPYSQQNIIFPETQKKTKLQLIFRTGQYAKAISERMQQPNRKKAASEQLNRQQAARKVSFKMINFSQVTQNNQLNSKTDMLRHEAREQTVDCSPTHTFSPFKRWSPIRRTELAKGEQLTNSSNRRRETTLGSLLTNYCFNFRQLQRQEIENERISKSPKRKTMEIPTVSKASYSNVIQLHSGDSRGWGKIREWYHQRVANRKVKKVINC